MKVVFISLGQLDPFPKLQDTLTINKVYETVQDKIQFDNQTGRIDGRMYYTIIDDIGIQRHYPIDYFKSLADLREDKLNKILE